MIHKKDVHVPEKTLPAETKSVFSHMSCDICSAISNDDENWNQNRFFHEEVKVAIKVCETYPQEPTSDCGGFDICPECFREKIIPFVLSFGKIDKIQEKESWYI